MTLLITLFAAIITSALWYSSESARQLKAGILCSLFWGASLMWFVDALFEYRELGADYFTPSTADMVNDSFLGASVIALALLIWLAVLFIKDPKQILKKSLQKQANQ